jgi:transcriptional regulator with XRE-family HTH domain
MKEKHLPGSLGDRVRELRERDKLTQGELASSIGTSASTLSRIEKGEIESPGSDIVKYGESLGMATKAISPGEHVHVHNLDSKRGRGDMA